MPSGDITDEQDDRLDVSSGSKPICGLTLEIVVPHGASEKEEVIDEAFHTCMNSMLTELFFEAPALATAEKTVKLELLAERGNVIYSTGDLDATNEDDHEVHTIRGLRGKTTFKVTCDATVTGAKTFFMSFRGTD